MEEKFMLYPVLHKRYNIRFSKGSYYIKDLRTEDHNELTQNEFILLSLFEGSYTLEEIINIYSGIFSISSEDSMKEVQELMTKYPERIVFQGESRQRRRLFRAEYYKRTNGKWPYSIFREKTPNRLSVILTEGCNHLCGYCFKSCTAERQQEVDAPKWMDVIGQADEIGVQEIYFSGGEPFLYKDFFSLLELCARKDIYMRISTNGTYLDEDTIKRLHDIGVDYIHLSLPAVTDSIYDKMTGSRGDLDKVKNAITVMKRHDFYIRVKMVLTPDNVVESEVEKMIDYCAGERIDFLHLAPYILTGKSRGGKALLADNEALVGMKEICAKKREEYPDFQFNDPPLTGPRWTGPRDISKCGGIRDGLLILSNGDIPLCESISYHKDFILGNIYHDSLREIWYSDKPDRITSLENRNLDETCKECEYFSRCQTGCFSYSNIHSGNPFSIDPRCWKCSGENNLFS